RSDTVIESEEIEVAVFSEFAREHGIGDVDLVKTDTEGFDFAVLEGMLDWLAERDRLPVILSELLARSYHPRWEHQERVLERLFELGYGKLDLTHMKKVEDFLFLPEQESRQQ
ncbi:MAG: FkbM family methyltransferase, partial [Planctomycetota bacterium]